MAINTGGGIDSQVRDQTDTFLTNPQAMQGAQQEVQQATKSGIAPDMIDLISVQAALAAKADAKKAVEASLNQQPGTIAAQRAEALQAATKDEIVGQVGATLDQRNKQAGQKMAQLQKQLGAPAAGPQMASGGIVGYQAGGSAGAVSSEQKATTILKSMGLTPDQYNSMPPEGQQRVLASLKSMGGGAPARPAPQMMGIAQQPAPQMMGIAQQPAPNMARMAGGGIVAFQKGGVASDGTDGEYTPSPEYARRLEIQNRVFRAAGLTPEVYDGLSVEGRQEISDVIRNVEGASPDELKRVLPAQLGAILSKEAVAMRKRVPDAYATAQQEEKSGTPISFDAAQGEAVAVDQGSQALRSAGDQLIDAGARKQPVAQLPNLFAPPPAAAAAAAPTAAAPTAAAPAAQTPAQIVLGPQGTAGITGAFNPAPIPRPADVGMAKTPLASGAIPAAKQAELAGRLGGIDAANLKLQNASGIEAAEERAGFVNEAMRREQNRGLLEGSRSDRQALLAQQAEEQELRRRDNPLGAIAARMSAGVGGIGGLGRLNLARQNEFRAKDAAGLASLDKDYAMRRNEVGFDEKAGKEAAEAGAQAFQDITAGQRQASANQTSLYNTESSMAKAEAANLLNRSVAALDSEDKALRRALDRGDRIYSADTKLQAAQMAAAAKIAKEQMASIDNERDREQAQRFAVAEARESATKLIAELHNELQVSMVYREASPEDQKVMWDRASKVGNDMYQVSRDMILDVETRAVAGSVKSVTP